MNTDYCGSRCTKFWFLALKLFFLIVFCQKKIASKIKIYLVCIVIGVENLVCNFRTIYSMRIDFFDESNFLRTEQKVRFIRYLYVQSSRVWNNKIFPKF